MDAELEQNERQRGTAGGGGTSLFCLWWLWETANSLPNKCAELEALVPNQRLYKESSMICLSESWLNDNTPDSCVDIPGDTAVRADHDWSTSGKRKGGGIILFFNQRRVNPRNVTVKESIWCPDIELLSVGFRSFYAPREFPYTVVIIVYIPPRAAPTTQSCIYSIALLQRRMTSSMTPLLGYRPSILRRSLQSQGILTTSLCPPA